MTDSPWTQYPHHEIEPGEAQYPEGFMYVERPPERVFVVGERSVLDTPSLAIVGSRKATPYGLACARHFAQLAALRGVAVVSGGAIGCDQAAHRGALEAGGRTLVVLGCGADVVYPSKAQDLFGQTLQQGGAIIAEAPWGSPPAKWGFRLRNRLIAGMAQATLIVEAGMPSGTFSTADATLAQGKEVLAIPGSIFAKESKGSNRLIAQGALPIVDDETFSDALMQIFGVLNFEAQSDLSHPEEAALVAGDETQARVFAAMVQQPQRAEELIGICGDSIIEVIRYLSALELRGLVTKLRDGRYAAARG
jgi:DNA processing protein